MCDCFHLAFPNWHASATGGHYSLFCSVSLAFPLSLSLSLCFILPVCAIFISTVSTSGGRTIQSCSWTVHVCVSGTLVLSLFTSITAFFC